MKTLLTRTPVRIGLIATLLLGSAALYVWLLLSIGVVGANANEKPRFFAFLTALWLLFAAAVWLSFKLRGKALVALIVLGTLLLGGVSMLQRPITSTDSARYNWDGIVQDAGISPYRYVPTDPALAPLRPHWLFQQGELLPDGSLKCHEVRSYPTTEVGTGKQLCTGVNRPHVPTIYPPVAEGLFALARLAVPADVTWAPMQVLGLLAVLGTTILLLYELRRLGRNPAWAAAWAWCPFVILEAVNNAHIDAVATVLAIAGTMLVVRQKRVWGGVVLGLSIATKFLPVVLTPPLVRQRPWRVILPAIGVFVLVYLPHVIAVGPEVIGYLPGYLQEEGYDKGTRSVLLSLVFPGSWSTLVAALILAALAVWVLRHADASNPWASQALLLGVALLLLSPRVPWYALLLVPLMILGKRFEWLPLVLLLELRELYAWSLVFQIGYAVVLVFILTVAVLRARRTRLAESDRLWRLPELN